MVKVLRKYLLTFIILNIFLILVNANSDNSFLPLTQYNRNLDNSDKPLSLSLSKKEALINAIRFTITFKDPTYDGGEEVTPFLKCGDDKTITFSSTKIQSNSVEVKEHLTNSEVLKLMNSATESLDCNVEIGLNENDELKIYSSDQNIKLIKARTSNEISFKYLDEAKAISYKSIMIQKIDPTVSYFYEIAYSDEITPLSKIEDTQKEIELDKEKKTYRLIIYNQNNEIIHITQNMTIISEDNIETSHHRKFYLPNTVLQTVRVSLYSDNIDIINLITGCYFSSENDRKIQLNKETQNEQNKIQFSNKENISSVSDDLTFTMHIIILEKDIETKEKIYVKKKDSDIFTWETKPGCVYYKQNFNYEIVPKESDPAPNLSLKLITNTANLDFRKVKNTFLLSPSDTVEIGTGAAKISVFEGDETEVSLFDASFNLTNLIIDPSSKEIFKNETIYFKGLICYDSSLEIKLEDNQTPSQSITLSCKFNNKDFSLNCPPETEYSKGNYTVKLDEKEIGTIRIFENKDSSSISVTLPEEVIYPGNNVVKITGVKDVEQIKVKINKEEIMKVYFSKGKTDKKSDYFTNVSDEEYSLELSLEIDTRYTIKEIITTDHLIYIFDDEKYVLGYFFSIDSNYYFINNENNQKVDLHFNSLAEAESNLANIYYKTDDSSLSSSICNLNSFVLTCDFKNPSENIEKLIFGIGKNFLSSQVIYFLKATVKMNEKVSTDKCFTYEESNEIKLTIDQKPSEITSIKAEIDEEFPLNSTTGNPDTYTFKIENLKVGVHKLYVTINEKKKIEVPNSSFTIIDSIKISSISSDELYYTSDQQSWTINFIAPITNDNIKNIILEKVDNTKVSNEPTIELVPTKKVGVFTYITFTLNNNTINQIGKYNIKYTSACNEKIETGYNVNIKNNKIESIIPFSLKVNNNKNKADSKFTVNFLHTIVNQPKKLNFIKNQNLIPPVEEDVPLDFTGTNNKNAFFTLGWDTSKIGLYGISVIYDSEIEEESTQTFLVYENDIELNKLNQITLVGKPITKLQIPLKNQIKIEQIHKIIYKPLNDKEKIIENFYLNGDENQIIIEENMEFTSSGDYIIEIYDAKDKTTFYTYTITAGKDFGILNASFDISINSQAIQGDNFIFIKSDNYDIEKIERVKFMKNNGDIITFCKKVSSISTCTPGFVIDYQLNGEVKIIKLVIPYTSEDKYKTKYTLKEIAETDESQTRQFEDGLYELLDYKLDKDVFYIPESGFISIVSIISLFDKQTAETIKDSISCKILNNSGITCQNYCNVKSDNDTQIECRFNFGDIIKDIPYDVNLKFTGLDENDKIIHLVKITTESDNLCQLKDDYEDVNIKVQSQTQIEDVMFYFGNENQNKVLSFLSNQDNTIYNVVIPKSLLSSTTESSSFIFKIGTPTSIVNTDKTINIVEEVMVEYNGQLTSQLEHPQYVELLFSTDINDNTIKSIQLRNDKSTLIPEICVKSFSQPKGLNCTFYLNDNDMTGDFTIYYNNSKCSREFNLGRVITIEEPPKILRDISPNYMKNNVEETFYLTYYYKLTTSNAPKKVKLLIDETSPGAGINEYPINQPDPLLNIVSFTIDTNIQPGYYYIKIINDENDDTKNEIYHDKNILIYNKEIEFNPSEGKKWDKENFNTITMIFKDPIIPQQIQSMTYMIDDGNEISLTKDIDYRVNETAITIIKNMEFDADKLYIFKIRDIAGNTAQYTVRVLVKTTLSSANLNIVVPKPGIEKEFNTISISSIDYDLSQLTKITLKKSDGTSYSINQQDFKIDDKTNTLSISIYLDELIYYTLSQIEDFSEKIEIKEEYILRGYYIVTDLFFYSLETETINLELDFYYQESAIANKFNIYMDLQENPLPNCQVDGTKVKCSVNPNQPTRTQLQPRNIFIGVKDDKNKKIVQLVSYDLTGNCEVMDRTNKKVKLIVKVASCLGDLEGGMGNQKVNSPCDEASLSYSFEFNGLTSTTESYQLYVKRLNTKIPSTTVYIPNEIVTLRTNTKIGAVFNSYQIYSTTEVTKIEVKFTTTISKDETKGLKLVKFDTNEEIIFDSCNFALSTYQEIIYSCQKTFTSLEKPGKYYVLFINKCGKDSEKEDNLFVTFIEAPNALVKVTPKSYQIESTSPNLRFLEVNSNNVFTAYFSEPLTLLNQPFSIKLLNEQEIESIVNNVTIDNTSISEKSLQFSLTTDSKFEEGLYSIKLEYPNDISYVSDHNILIYKNTLELKNNSEEIEIGANLSSIVIEFKNALHIKQINKITYVKESDENKEEIVPDYGLIENSFNKIFIKFSNIIIDDNYIIYIYDNAEENRILTYRINYTGNSDYTLEKDIYFIDQSLGSIDIVINSQYSMNNFYYLTTDTEKLPLTCNQYQDGQFKCTYQYQDFFTGKTITIQRGDSNLSLTQKKIYLVKYSHVQRPLISEYYSETFLSAISPISLEFYLDNIQLISTPTNSQGLYTYILNYYMLSNILTEEGNYILYAKKLNEEKVTINDIHYIHITDKQATQISTLYSNYIGKQTIDITFNKNLIDSEIAKITLSLNDVDYDTTYCIRKENTLNSLLCEIDLENASSGSYSVSYTNILNNKVNLLEQLQLNDKLELVTISPDLAEITQGPTITLSYSQNLNCDTYKITFVNVIDNSELEPSISESCSNLEVKNIIKFSLTNAYIAGQYKIKTELTIEGVTQEVDTKSNIYIVLHKTESNAFDFSRLYYIIKPEPFTINIIPKLNAESISNIYLQGNDTPLSKVDNKYLYTIPANSIPSTLSFEYTSTNAGDNKLNIKEKVLVVSNYKDLFTFTSPFSKCNFSGSKYTITLEPKEGVNIDPTRIQIILYRIVNNYKDKEYTFTYNSGYKYTFEIGELSELLNASFILYITEKGDVAHYLYKEEDIIFTPMTPPEYIYQTDNSMKLTGVICNLSLKGRLFTLIKEQHIKTLSITESSYDEEEKSLSITFSNNIIKELNGSYQIFSHTNDLLGTTYISTLLESNGFSVSALGNTVSLTGTYYMPLVTSVSVRKNKSETIIIYPPTSTQEGKKFSVDKANNKIIFELDLTNTGNTYTITQISVFRVDIPINSSSNDLFSLEQDMFFIDSSQPSTKITIKLTFKSDVQNIENVSIEGVTVNAVFIGSNSYSFDFIASTARTIYVTYQGSGVIEKKPVYLSTYTYTGKTCQIISDVNNSAFIITVTSPESAPKYTMSFGDNYILEQTNTLTVNYKTIIQFLLPKDKINNASTFPLYANVENVKIPVSNISIVAYNPISITNVSGTLIKNTPSQTLTISLSSQITDNDKPQKFHLRKVEENEPLMEATATDCTLSSNKQTIECVFNLTSVIEGKYNLLYLTKCNTLVSYDESITILSQPTNKMEPLDNNVITINTKKSRLRMLLEITLRYSTSFNEGEAYRPNQILLINKNNGKIIYLKPLFIEGNLNTVKVSLDTVPEGIYEIKTQFMVNNEPIISNDSQTIIIQSNEPKLRKTEETIIQNTKITWLSIEFENDIFSGRFNKITYTNIDKAPSPVKLTYKVDDDEKNIVKVNTENIDFSSQNDYIFTLEDSYSNPSKSFVFTVHITPGIDITINHYLFIIDMDDSPTVEITVSDKGVGKVYIKKESGYQELNNSTGKYIYTSNTPETVYIAYTSKQGEDIIDLSLPIIIAQSLKDVLNFEIDSCQYYNQSPSIQLQNKESYKIDLSKFIIKLTHDSTSDQAIYDSSTNTYKFTNQISQEGEFTYTILLNDNPTLDRPILYSQTVTYTNISLSSQSSYVFNDSGSIELITKCALGNNIYFTTYGVPLACSYSQNKETCKYTNNYIESYKVLYFLKYKDINLNLGVYIYKALPTASLSITKPTINLGENNIIITSSDYNLAIVDSIILVDENNSDVVYCKSSQCDKRFVYNDDKEEISFVINFNDKTNYYYIRSISDTNGNNNKKTFGNNEYEYKLIIPSEINIPSFKYVTTSDSRVKINVNFVDNFYYNIIFNSIQLKEDNPIEFTFGDENKCSQLTCELTSVKSVEELIFSGSQIKMEFSFYDTNNELRIVPSNNAIRLININNLPTEISGYKISQIEGQTTFKLTFNKEIYQEYIDNNGIIATVVKESDSSERNCDVKLNGTDLEMTCLYKITDDSLIKVTLFNEKEISKSVKFSCEFPKVYNIVEGDIVCDTCEKINPSSPIYNNGVCVSICPDNKFLYSSICYDSCTEVTEFTEDKKCVEKCSEDYYTENETSKNCIHCKNNNLFIFDNHCISQCPENYYKENETSVNCVNCKEKGLLVYNGYCVSSCLNGYYKENENSEKCVNCKEQNLFVYNNSCVSQCPTETTPNQNNECIETTENNCTNYCIHGTCSLNDGLPNCSCQSQYYGIKCSHYEQDLSNDISKIIQVISDSSQSNSLNLTNNDVFFNIRDLNAIIEQKPDAVNLVGATDKGKIFTSVLKVISVETNKDLEPQMTGFLELMGIALDFETSTDTRLRNLEQANVENIKQIINNGANYYKELSKAFISKINDSNEKYHRIDVVPRKHLYFFSYINKKDSIEAYQESAKSDEKAYVDFSDCLSKYYQNQTNNSNLLYVGTGMTSSLRNVMLNSTTYSDMITVSGLIDSSEENFSKCDNIKVSIPVIQDINLDLYSYYKSKGIDIYNPNDSAFTDRCYANGNFSADLITKYRKINVFQNKTFNSDHNCTFVGIDEASNTVNFVCSNGDIGYNFEDSNLENYEMFNSKKLTMKCVGHVNVGKNFAFYFSLFVLLALVAGEILIFLFYETLYKSSYGSSTKNNNYNTGEVKVTNINDHVKTDDHALEKSNIKQSWKKISLKARTRINGIDLKTVEVKGSDSNLNDVSKDKNDNQVNKEEVKVVAPSQVNVEIETSYYSFVDLLIKNFKELNPFAFIYEDAIKPVFMTQLALLITNLYVLFGFNAVFFSDSMLEDRIYDSYRDNFGYPMRSEFDKIICSILVTFLITIALKFIVLIPFSDKDSFSITDFYHIINIVRFIVCGVLMLFLLLFFSIYNTAFCGLFRNAKYGWLYSGIWSLFMNWIIFYPVGIILITLIEKNVNWGYKDEIVYYLKRILF